MADGDRQSILSSLLTAGGISGVIDAINKLEQAMRDILAFNNADNETPSGILDGANTSYALANLPNPSGSLRVYLDGMLMTVGEDYTISGVDITFLEAPFTGSVLRAFYRY